VNAKDVRIPLNRPHFAKGGQSKKNFHFMENAKKNILKKLPSILYRNFLSYQNIIISILTAQTVHLRSETGGDLDIHSPVLTTCTTRFKNKRLCVLHTPCVHVFHVTRRTAIFFISNSMVFLTEVDSVFDEVQNKNCALLGYYVASSDNFFPTFRYNLSVRAYHTRCLMRSAHAPRTEA